MLKNSVCPISDKSVDSAHVRTHALINVVLLIFFLFTQSIWIALFILSDFLVRVANFPKLSLVGYAAGSLARFLPLKSKKENAGPKLFAARIGLVFAILISILLSAGNPAIAIALACVLAFFSLLEGAFGICVACIFYPWVYQLFYKNKINEGTPGYGKFQKEYSIHN